MTCYSLTYSFLIRLCVAIPSCHFSALTFNFESFKTNFSCVVRADSHFNFWKLIDASSDFSSGAIISKEFNFFLTEKNELWHDTLWMIASGLDVQEV